METLFQYLSTRDWNSYALIPPVFALLVSSILLPVFDRIWKNQSEDQLRGGKAIDHLHLIDALARDRELRLAYLVTWPSFIVTLIATAKPHNIGRFAVMAAILLLVMLVLFLCVFLPKLGSNQTRYIWGKLEASTALSWAISLINFAFLVLIIADLPARGTI